MTSEELTEVSAAITAAGVGGKDEMYSWIRGHLYFYQLAAPTLIGWALIRCPYSDAVQNLLDPDVMEPLQHQKRIISRGWISNPPANAGRVSPVKFEVFNFKLPVDEELRFVYCPWQASAAVGYEIGTLEWRQIGE